MESTGTTSGPPLRWYQQKCVEAAKGENLLVVLPTNSGKTRIAAELLDHYLTQWRCDPSESKKRKWCVLLTPTGPLADQQGQVLARSCGLDLASEVDGDEDAEGASHRVAIVRGQQATRSKRGINARNAWKRCATLVMTPALLVDSLIHARVVMTDIVLLVLDEAHQLKGTSEYAILMKRFYSGAPAALRPRVLALTASPLSGRAPNGKSWQPATEEDMKRELEELEEKVDCRTWTELGLVEAEMLKTTVEERSFEMANSTDRHKELLEMIRSAKLEMAGNNRQRDQILRWNRALERFEAEDGERCSIALELGEWATLQGLQLLCRGQAPSLLEEEEDAKDEEKSNGEDEKAKNVEPEELICEARERLQGKLTQWQEKQTEKLHSSKALALIQKLRERFEADGGDMKCIVFTRTRALCQLLAMVLESEEGLPGVTYVVGGNECRTSSWRIRQTASSQKQALAKFARPHNEEGAVSIVVATSVLAEGIDIPSCGLVLCFDSAVSPLQHVQLRGRARRAGSEFTVLVPRGSKAVGALAGGPSLQQLKDYEVRVLNVLKAWSLRPPHTRQLGPSVSSEEVLEISSSGARLPLEKAKNYLHVSVYGYLIPSEKSNEREILDFCKPGFRDNEKKYDYSMFQVKSTEQGWYCELELPPVGCCSLLLEEQTAAAAACDHSWWRKKEKPLCQEHLGMVVGPVVTQKGQAKDAAALRACRILHQMGILDDHLKVKGREQFQHLIKQATGAGKASGKRRSDDAIALASIETLERLVIFHSSVSFLEGKPPILDGFRLLPPSQHPPKPREPGSLASAAMGSLKRTLELGLEQEPKISLVDLAVPSPLGPKALAPQIASRRGSATLRIAEKANEMRSAGKEVYALGFGQSPFPVPACMVRKLKEHAEVNKYLPVRGHPHLRQAIAEWAVHHKGVMVTAEDVMVGPGSKQLIYLLQAVLQCQLLLPRPSWVSYAPQAELLGREVFWVDTSEGEKWQLQAAALDAACQASTKSEPRLLIFNNPCNPTGTACTPEQVKALAEVARKHRLLVLADEIYDLMQFDGKHESFAKHYPEGTIILTGISKTSGGGGWRMGAFVFPPALRCILDAMAVYASETHSSVSAPIQFGSIPAFQTHQDSEDARAMRHYHRASRHILAAVGQTFADVVNADGECRVVPPTGGFYAWLNAELGAGVATRLGRRGLSSAEQLAEQLLRDTGVATLPGDAYGWDRSKLCLHIAFVDFDGAQAIEHVHELPRFHGRVDPKAMRNLRRSTRPG
eukprot:s194_g13.t1